MGPMFKLNMAPGGINKIPPEWEEIGMAPRWMSHVTVDICFDNPTSTNLNPLLLLT